MRIVEAAGGVVRRGDEILLIRQREHPDTLQFPKGRVDPGEQPPQTAMREVWEETGVVTHSPQSIATIERPSLQGGPGGELVHKRIHMYALGVAMCTGANTDETGVWVSLVPDLIDRMAYPVEAAFVEEYLLAALQPSR